MSDNRSFETIKGIFGEKFTGTWVSDRYGAQLKIKAKYRQLCLVHLVRDLEYVIQTERSRAAYEYQRLLYKLMDTWKRWYKEKAEVTAQKKIYIVNQLYRQLTGLCQQAMASKYADAMKPIPEVSRNQQLRRTAPIRDILVYCSPMAWWHAPEKFTELVFDMSDSYLLTIVLVNVLGIYAVHA